MLKLPTNNVPTELVQLLLLRIHALQNPARFLVSLSLSRYVTEINLLDGYVTPSMLPKSLRALQMGLKRITFPRWQLSNDMLLNLTASQAARSLEYVSGPASSVSDEAAALWRKLPALTEVDLLEASKVGMASVKEILRLPVIRALKLKKVRCVSALDVIDAVIELKPPALHTIHLRASTHRDLDEQGVRGAIVDKFRSWSVGAGQLRELDLGSNAGAEDLETLVDMARVFPSLSVLPRCFSWELGDDYHALFPELTRCNLCSNPALDQQALNRLSEALPRLEILIVRVAGDVSLSRFTSLKTLSFSSDDDSSLSVLDWPPQLEDLVVQIDPKRPRRPGVDLLSAVRNISTLQVLQISGPIDIFAADALELLAALPLLKEIRLQVLVKHSPETEAISLTVSHPNLAHLPRLKLSDKIDLDLGFLPNLLLIQPRKRQLVTATTPLPSWRSPLAGVVLKSNSEPPRQQWDTWAGLPPFEFYSGPQIPLERLPSFNFVASMHIYLREVSQEYLGALMSLPLLLALIIVAEMDGDARIYDFSWLRHRLLNSVGMQFGSQLLPADRIVLSGDSLPSLSDFELLYMDSSPRFPSFRIEHMPELLRFSVRGNDSERTGQEIRVAHCPHLAAISFSGVSPCELELTGLPALETAYLDFRNRPETLSIEEMPNCVFSTYPFEYPPKSSKVAT